MLACRANTIALSGLTNMGGRQPKHIGYTLVSRNPPKENDGFSMFLSQQMEKQQFTIPSNTLESGTEYFFNVEVKNYLDGSST